MIYERRHQPLASARVFRQRLLATGSVGLALVAISLGIGIAGYAGFEGLSTIDAFLDAAMILSGMGPIHQPTTTGGKIFAGLYALYSGFAVLAIAAVVFAPVIHRVLHRFHLEEAQEREVKKPPPPRGG